MEKKDELDNGEMKLTFFFFATPHSLQHLSSLTRDPTQAITVEVPSSNYWTIRESWNFRFLSGI